MEMMSPESQRWFTEPVHDIGTIRSVAIAILFQHALRILRGFKTAHTGHDVDDGLCIETGRRRAANMFDRADDPFAQNIKQALSLLLEPIRPGRIVRDENYRRFH